MQDERDKKSSWWKRLFGSNGRADTPQKVEPGLHVIFDSERDDQSHSVAEIDVVAVHGLNFKGSPDHARTTWTKGDKLWLQDFLPARLPKPARVMLFAYNSSPAIGAAAIQLDDHAKTLLQWLNLERQNAPHRPLIFICHSLGGLVVKQALIDAKLDESYKLIFDATRLLVFFATPHQGGGLATVGDIAVKIARAVAWKPDNRLVDALKRGSNEATDRFRQARHVFERCLVVNFFEGKPYGLFGIIVGRDCATLNLPGLCEKQVAMEADHSAICKFESAGSLACKLVLDTIATEFERALGIAQNIEAHLDNSKLLAERVLSCLHFRWISDRYVSVKSAHKDTFQWIYGNTSEESSRWDNLSAWLERDKGIYWVNGKAGSGKSTLMKFIYEDERTMKHLWRWSGCAKLITASFFFWALGTPLQKSHEGILRSLLFDILTRHRDLIPSVMPDLAREVSKQVISEPTLPELKRWFKQLVKAASSQYNACVFIDGLDEFAGSCSDLTDFLVEVSALSPNFKFVLASRPIPDCKNAFCRGPSVCLHELTRNDIRRYAEDLLAPRLKSTGNPQLPRLLDEVVDKSSGVFLWVYVISKSVLDGLKKNDDLAELRERLKELPQDLHDLYKYTLKRIEPRYAKQAFQIFKIVLASLNIEEDDTRDGLLALQLSMCWDDWNVISATQFSPMSAEEIEKRCKQVRGRLESRCLGLLELRGQPAGSERVQFIHRSAVEYLTTMDCTYDLGCQNLEFEFNEFQLLVQSCIMMGKCFPPAKIIKHSDGSNDTPTDRVWNSLVDGLKYARAAELSGKPVNPFLLDQLDDVFSEHWKRGKVYLGGGRLMLDASWIESDRIPTTSHWSRGMFAVWDSDYAVGVPEMLSGALVSCPSIHTHRRAYGKDQMKPFLPFIVILDDTFQHFLKQDSFTRVAIIFSLATYIRSRILPTPTSLRSGQTPDPGLLSRLLCIFVHSIILRFKGMVQTDWTEANAQICAALLSAGADPNYPVYESYTTWTLFISGLLFILGDGNDVWSPRTDGRTRYCKLGRRGRNEYYERWIANTVDAADLEEKNANISECSRQTLDYYFTKYPERVSYIMTRTPDCLIPNPNDLRIGKLEAKALESMVSSFIEYGANLNAEIALYGKKFTLAVYLEELEIELQDSRSMDLRAAISRLREKERVARHKNSRSTK